MFILISSLIISVFFKEKASNNPIASLFGRIIINYIQVYIQIRFFAATWTHVLEIGAMLATPT